jgi:hypothetical protein
MRGPFLLGGVSPFRPPSNRVGVEAGDSPNLDTSVIGDSPQDSMRAHTLGDMSPHYCLGLLVASLAVPTSAVQTLETATARIIYPISSFLSFLSFLLFILFFFAFFPLFIFFFFLF